MPNIAEIYSIPILQPNIIEGKYENVDHYLDVQFRLLKEDFVKPIRDDIIEFQNFKNNEKSSKIKKANIYQDVYITDREFVNGKMCHLLKFSSKEFYKIDWKKNNHFSTGSLIILSSDDFKTMKLATVAHRDPEELEFGMLLIHFTEFNDQEFNFNTERNFVVMEAPTFLEAYQHNLKALQEINADTFPFQDYIINVKTNNIKQPHYLKKCTTYDMRPLLFPMGYPHITLEIAESGEEFIHYKFPENCNVGKCIEVLNDDSWPSAPDLNLDPSQYLALKAALTREFVILQGPPGTGKTYIGLRIVQLLLHNIDQWFTKETNSLPILVVAQTNHALDQFLQGVMSFTHKIVRIGGQGKNENIYSFRLDNLKKFHKTELPENLRRDLYDQKQQVEILKRELQ